METFSEFIFVCLVCLSIFFSHSPSLSLSLSLLCTFRKAQAI